MEHLPIYLHVLSIFCTAACLGLFYLASNRSLTAVLIIVAWLMSQAFLSFSGFYQVTTGMPPRFLALVVPPVLLIIAMLTTSRGKRFSAELNISTLTLMHTLRVPVEIMLYGLSVYKVIPELMTFEGRNMDIFSGLTAPIIFYFGFIKKTLAPKWIIAWNIICIGLLLNVVVHAILSAPTDFQRLAFDQPNIAVTYFPFVWLPCFIVPLVLYSHLVSIRQLARR